MFSAISTLCSIDFGNPFSSIVRPITQAPYFLAIGKICSMCSFLPVTEFKIGFPLNVRAPDSNALKFALSI